jgi:hypothetical protein
MPTLSVTHCVRISLLLDVPHYPNQCLTPHLRLTPHFGVPSPINRAFASISPDRLTGNLIWRTDSCGSIMTLGVGIVGKEGKQASLAADFSVTQFSYLTKLLVWHGRNSYKRSAKLAQFVIHRGLIISVMQAVFSAIFYFAPIALYQGWLMVGYATVYTMAPVFSLVLDRDVSEDLALLYPELYKELTKVCKCECSERCLMMRLVGSVSVVQNVLYVVRD